DAHADRPMLKESLGPGMPRAYRTPNLVDYLRGGPAPTPRSDVFQLGLVLAEVFTGKNPLQPLTGEDFTAPVELVPLDPIPGELGEPLRYRLQEMLARKPEDRPTAAD